MTISGSLATYLLSVAGVTALIADRLHPEVAESLNETRPLVTYSIEERRAEESTDSLIDLMEVNLTVKALCDNYDEAFEVAHAIRRALEFYKGIMGGASGLRVEMCALDGIAGDYNGEFDAYATFSNYTLQYIPQ